jgi:hypothetical protein
MFLTPFKLPEAALENLDGNTEGEQDSDQAGFVEEGAGEQTGDEGEGSEGGAGAEGEGEGEGQGEEDGGEAVDDLPDDADLIEDMDDEEASTEALAMEIDHLMNLGAAMEQYGINPGMMQVADRDGLLSSTFSVIPATESLTGAYRPDGPTTIAALEGIVSAVGAKIAHYAIKAGAAIGKLAHHGVALVKRAVDGVVSFGSSIASKTWNAAKATGQTIKAHPYKTVVATIGAIAAAAAVIALVWGFPAAPAGVTAWISKIQTALGNVKSPFGSLSLAKVGNRFKPVWTATESAAKTVSGTAVKLGYQSKAVLVSGASSLKGALGKALSALDRVSDKVIRPLVKAEMKIGSTVNRHATKTTIKVGTAIARGARDVGEFAGAAAEGAFRGVAISAISVAISVTWTLLVHVIIKGYKLVRSAFASVASATTGEAAA